MEENIIYNSLAEVTTEEVYTVFIDAFSNYQVKLDMSFEKFENLMKRRSVDFSISTGVFDGHKLIGFVLNGKRRIGSELVAYDSGTGMLHAYQGQKLSKKMLEENIKFLNKNNFDKYLLEVLTANEKAFNLYKGFDFAVTREFHCFKNEAGSLNEVNSNSAVTVKKIEFSEVDWEKFGSYFDFKVSWQNSIAAIKEDCSKFAFLEAGYENKLAGYGVIESETGDIPLLAVDSDYRNRSVGSMILRELKGIVQTQSLRFLNIPSNAVNMNKFLMKHNFQNFVQQYEMDYKFR